MMIKLVIKLYKIDWKNLNNNNNRLSKIVFMINIKKMKEKV
jgi:hypothetical protein